MDSTFYRTNAARAELITGEASCGKTEALIERITAMLAGGTNPAGIAVACASPLAAQDFQRRLAARAGEQAAAVRVQPARAFALDVLGTPDAIEATGREPRLLAQFEISFLMEDMKTCGLRPRRLKEMLKFFYRTWTELGDWEDGWLLQGEESSVHALLKENLAAVRGVLEPEAANLVVRYLTDHADARAELQIPHVLVDDYQALSGASQVLMGLLAGESLTVAGCAHESTDAYDSYPYEQGIELFAEGNPSCERTELTSYHHGSVVQMAVRGLLAKEVGDEGLPALTAAEGTPAGSVRMASFERALRAAEMPARSTGTPQPRGGDVRDRERSGAALLFTALRLVADPSDGMAWRAWCGFGDYLAHSNSFIKLRRVMEEQELTLPEALAYAEDQSTIGADVAKILPPYEFGREMIAACEGLTGPQLLDKLAARIEATDAEKAAVVKLCAPAESETAAQLVARAEAELLAPTCPAGTVRVVAPEFACGLTPRLLVFCGFLNGFVPCRAYFDGAEMPLDKQEKEHARLVRQLYTVLAKAQERLVCTHFEKTDLETAERMKLKIHRIRMEKGKRTALMEQSIFADYLMPTA